MRTLTLTHHVNANAMRHSPRRRIGAMCRLLKMAMIISARVREQEQVPHFLARVAYTHTHTHTHTHFLHPTRLTPLQASAVRLKVHQAEAQHEGERVAIHY